jgi:hypothetical protein
MFVPFLFVNMDTSCLLLSRIQVERESIVIKSCASIFAVSSFRPYSIREIERNQDQDLAILNSTGKFLCKAKSATATT